jgi:hypothetical protein
MENKRDDETGLYIVKVLLSLAFVNNLIKYRRTQQFFLMKSVGSNPTVRTIIANLAEWFTRLT